MALWYDSKVTTHVYDEKKLFKNYEFVENDAGLLMGNNDLAKVRARQRSSRNLFYFRKEINLNQCVIILEWCTCSTRIFL